MNQSLEFQPFEESNLESCLQIFNSNCPQYFLEHERQEFIDYLANPHGSYWIAKKNDEIIGCGGIYLDFGKSGKPEFENEAGFAWGMIHSKFHGKGFGKKLTKFRLEHLQDNYPERTIVLRTSQNTYQFFQKMGFSIHSILKNGFGAGMDKYTMVFRNETIL